MAECVILHFKTSILLSKGIPDFYLKTNPAFRRRHPVRSQKDLAGIIVKMERETGIEPATSSLGSWRSTAELLPLSWANVP